MYRFVRAPDRYKESSEPYSSDIERMLNLDAAGRTDVGQVRTTNEDAFGYCVEDGVFALCDGMGGAAAGAVASPPAVDTLIERLSAARSHENRRKVLEEAIAEANQRVHTRAEKERTL